MVQNIQVQVSKEAYDLGQHLVKFTAAMKQALADGFQLGGDLPVLLAATMSDIIPALQAINSLPAAEHENVKAFVMAFELAATDLAFLFKK